LTRVTGMLHAESLVDRDNRHAFSHSDYLLSSPQNSKTFG